MTQRLFTMERVRSTLDVLVFHMMRPYMMPSMAPTSMISPSRSESWWWSSSSSLLEQSVMWAQTPKSNRSIRCRRTRRFGILEWGRSKLERPNRKIRVDHHTSEYFILNQLAPKTYVRVMEESKRIQEAARKAFGMHAMDKEINVLYTDDKKEESEEGDKSKRVELEKERPGFFARNLVEKVNKAEVMDATTTTVRPTGLG